MSTDPSAAIGRIDAAVEESSRPPGAPPRELADLAAVIERIESLIAEGAAQGPGRTASVERISDIAFTLQEREVETSLCDTLDAAVREINDVGALKDGSAERRQQAGELLRQLSRRVHEMIAQSHANQRPEPVVGAGAAQTPNKAGRALLDEGDGEDDALGGGSFKTDVPEDDEFALVVAALTATLPSLAEFGAPVPVPPAALAQEAVPFPDGALLPELSVETADEGKAAESATVLPHAESSDDTVVVIDSSRAVLMDEPVLPQTPSSEPLALGEDFVRDLMPNENPAAEPSGEAVSSSDEPVEDSALEALLALPKPNAPADSTHAASPEPSGGLVGREAELPTDAEEQRVAAVVDPALVDAARTPRGDRSSGAPLPLVAPEDDPGDLFESAMPEPSIVPTSEGTGVHAAERVPEAERAVEPALSVPAPLDSEPQAPPLMPPPQSRAATAAPAQPQPVPRPASNDPLAPIRALTEEEMIALFS